MWLEVFCWVEFIYFWILSRLNQKAPQKIKKISNLWKKKSWLNFVVPSDIGLIDI